MNDNNKETIKDFNDERLNILKLAVFNNKVVKGLRQCKKAIEAESASVVYLSETKITEGLNILANGVKIIKETIEAYANSNEIKIYQIKESLLSEIAMKKSTGKNKQNRLPKCICCCVIKDEEKKDEK